MVIRLDRSLLLRSSTAATAAAGGGGAARRRCVLTMTISDHPALHLLSASSSSSAGRTGLAAGWRGGEAMTSDAAGLAGRQLRSKKKGNDGLAARAKQQRRR